MVRVFKAQPENQSLLTVARVLAPDGTVLTPTNVSALTYTIYDRDAELPATPIKSETSLTVSDVMQTALTVDGYWPYDSTGYNFKDTRVNGDVSGSFTQRGGHTYEIVYKLTTTSWGVLYVTSVFMVTSA